MTDDERINQELAAAAVSSNKNTASGHIAEPPPPNDISGVRIETGLDLSQWAVGANGIYFATSRTVPVLPAAAYNIGYDPNRGQVFLQKQSLLSDSIIMLPDSVSEKAVNRVRRFWQSKDLYSKHGLLHKTGILFFGPPGSGKTTTIHAIVAEMIKMNGVVIFSDNPELMKNMLTQLRAVEPDRPLIAVLEDVDEIMRVHGESKVLSVLDGENRISNCVFLATTNYVWKLGARIVNRPARFDERLYIGMPSERDRESYLRHSVGDSITAGQIQQWVQDTEGLSISHLRELVAAVLCLQQEYETVLQRLKSMMYEPKVEENEGWMRKSGMGLAPVPYNKNETTKVRSTTTS